MKERATLWFIRHGESDDNAGLKISNASGFGLTDVGWGQANKIAAHFDAGPERIVVSNFRRAQETAKPTIERFPRVPVVCLSVHEFTYLKADDYSGTFERKRSAVNAYWDDMNPHSVADASAESFAQFVSRVKEFKRALEQEDSARVAVFSHRKFLSALIWLSLSVEVHVSKRRMRQFHGFDRGLSISNGAIIPCEIIRGKLWFGPIDTSHLGDS